MTQPRCVVWTTPEQAPLLDEIVRLAGITIIGAGCPDSARTGQVASALSCEPTDDLRLVMNAHETDMVLLGDAGSFGEEANDADLDALRAAHARNVCVTTLEPIPATASGIMGTSFAEALHQGVLGTMASFVPLLRYRPILSELSTVLETFAPVRSASLTIAGPSALGSLGARLFNALDLTRWLMGVPSIIEAAYISPRAGRGMHPLPGQTLRGLHGEITMNLRFSDGRCAAIYLSDQFSASALSMTIASAEGQMAVDQRGFVWSDNQGQEVDRHNAPDPHLNSDRGALQTQLTELCSGVVPARPPIDFTSVLSMTHAALLSTRTGQGESPHDVEQLMLSM
ncbi:MAG: hypothetical protein ACF8MF_08010 [Phycisphaerales bacterium JB052]